MEVFDWKLTHLCRPTATAKTIDCNVRIALVVHSLDQRPDYALLTRLPTNVCSKLFDWPNYPLFLVVNYSVDQIIHYFYVVNYSIPVGAPQCLFVLCCDGLLYIKRLLIAVHTCSMGLRLFHSMNTFDFK